MTNKMITLIAGQEVKILGRGGTTRATVVKVGRVWCELQRQGGGCTERFRMDTRTPYAPGKGYGSAPRFYTLEEWAERERAQADLAFLNKQAIRFDTYVKSPWTVSALAGALRLAQAVGDPRELLALIEKYGDDRAVPSRDEAATLAEIKQRLGITDAE